MNIRELGQAFVTGISGLALTNEEKEFIEKENIGGVILFKENYKDPAQLSELVNEIQALRDEYPLFISVDQEGGRVRRFQSHFTQFPSMYEIGQKNSPKNSALVELISILLLAVTFGLVKIIKSLVIERLVKI